MALVRNVEEPLVAIEIDPEIIKPYFSRAKGQIWLPESVKPETLADFKELCHSLFQVSDTYRGKPYFLQIGNNPEKRPPSKTEPYHVNQFMLFMDYYIEKIKSSKSNEATIEAKSSAQYTTKTGTLLILDKMPVTLEDKFNLAEAFCSNPDFNFLTFSVDKLPQLSPKRFEVALELFQEIIDECKDPNNEIVKKVKIYQDIVKSLYSELSHYDLNNDQEELTLDIFLLIEQIIGSHINGCRKKLEYLNLENELQEIKVQIQSDSFNLDWDTLIKNITHLKKKLGDIKDEYQDILTSEDNRKSYLIKLLKKHKCDSVAAKASHFYKRATTIFQEEKINESKLKEVINLCELALLNKIDEINYRNLYKLLSPKDFHSEIPIILTQLALLASEVLVNEEIESFYSIYDKDFRAYSLYMSEQDNFKTFQEEVESLLAQAKNKLKIITGASTPPGALTKLTAIQTSSTQANGPFNQAINKRYQKRKI